MEPMSTVERVFSPAAPLLCACTVKGSGIGDFGGGSLEHPRPWLGAQRAGLALGVPGCLELPGVP